ncbi:hypothetical protein PAPYR_2391 [Paratrimastix pyriformis]|uniref:F-box domain-containing protein n=1 Tax=Paratrimastix pyriformis TaxID=342808 RepID=A0ABQ8UQ96_9EUKA|nr:hypothetical protein PAPYR_2391 [Paratrimastix pyriformis]
MLGTHRKHTLPPDVVGIIFGSLNARDLANVACVCRSWHELAKSDYFWERLYHLKPQWDEPTYVNTWRDAYKNKFLNEKQRRKEAGLAALRSLNAQKRERVYQDVGNASYPHGLFFMPLMSSLIITFFVLAPMKADGWLDGLSWGWVISFLVFGLGCLSIICTYLTVDLARGSDHDRLLIIGGIFLPIPGTLSFLLVALRAQFPEWVGLPVTVCFVPVYLHALYALGVLLWFLLKEGELRKWVIVGIPYGTVALEFLVQPLLVGLRCDGLLGAASWFVLLVPTWVTIFGLVVLTLYVMTEFRRCRLVVFVLWSFVFWIPLTVTAVLLCLRLDGLWGIRFVFILIPPYIYLVVLFITTLVLFGVAIYETNRHSTCPRVCCFWCYCSYALCCHAV